MYLYHFGIRELPFTLTPNTQYFFGLPSHKEAIEVLTTALDAGEGFIKVTGEVGTGKTLICRKLLNELDKNFVSAYIPNPYLSPIELRKAVASELNVELSDGGDQQEFTQRIQKRLIEIRKSKRSAVLIIDEAQALPDESIEALRLMTNLETESHKLMQVVLFGQPELNEKIARKELRQLRQRITFSYHLQQMDAHQIEQYISHRMRVAGHATGSIFEPGVCEYLQIASRGTPRIVNVLCHKALMLAFGEGSKTVTQTHIQLAAKDTEAAFAIPKSRWFSWLLPSAAAALVVLMLGAAYMPTDEAHSVTNASDSVLQVAP
ncbi:AAA family ATPase [Glaciecola sp. XM2]|jgi:MSHA biogenesis protein MshM|uniref:ExeA family protein n=1 Tax=Glaciecola sp. XM2 TaxID=1914931 RepID=UPI001BDDCAD4|nr:AAA family ATPase [Glaciecola sp. XM2]MBT1451692.1 AAA family ATPase [Glaciecola sp. XM2]